MNNIIEPSQLQPSDLENRSDSVIGEGASALQKQINHLNLQVASQQQQGRQYLDQAVGYERQECTPCMAYSSPKYDDFSSKFDDIDVREILYSYVYFTFIKESIIFHLLIYCF